MPNLPVDVSSWGRSACYPRRTFYPMSDGPSMRNHRITISNFRPCSTRRSHSQACLCYCTPRTVTKRTEHTFESLRYTFGGDHPSQTTHHTLFPLTRIRHPPFIFLMSNPLTRIRHQENKGWYFTVDSPEPSGPGSKPPTYPTHHLPNVNAKL